MNTDCYGCVHFYYEKDTNFKDCKYADFDIEEPDKCPGYYDKEDAKADAKYGRSDRY